MKKRIIAMLLTLCIVVGLLPGGVLAAEGVGDAVAEGEQIVYQINPGYAASLTELQKAELCREIDRQMEALEDEPGDTLQGYLSPGEATAYIRNKMLARTEAFQVQLCYTGTPTNDELKRIVDGAFIHDGIGTHGDYLFWSQDIYGFRKTIDGTSGAYTYVTIEIGAHYFSTAAQESAVDTAVQDLMEELELGTKGTDAYKVRTIYQWLCDNVTYDSSLLGTNPAACSAYGAMVAGTCVGQSCALVLYHLLLTAGIDSRIVSSFSHQWNLVGIGDGYYYLDGAWDAGVSEPKYVLAGRTSFDETNYHAAHCREDGSRYGGYDYRYGSEFDRAYPVPEGDYPLSNCDRNGHSWAVDTETPAGPYENGERVFCCNVCGERYREVLPCIAENPFADVAFPEYYYGPVLWAYHNQITAGITASSFQPNGISTRAQFVTFLWRCAGKPEPEITENPFVDLDEAGYYYDAVLWAYQEGITQGISPTTFAPAGKLSRAQVVSFLWRYHGKPVCDADMSFLDVDAQAYYYDAVLWAAERGIASGMAPGRFDPNGSCTRGQIVSFLYRDAHTTA